MKLFMIQKNEHTMQNIQAVHSWQKKPTLQLSMSSKISVVETVGVFLLSRLAKRRRSCIQLGLVDDGGRSPWKMAAWCRFLDQLVSGRNGYPSRERGSQEAAGGWGGRGELTAGDIERTSSVWRLRLLALCERGAGGLET